MKTITLLGIKILIFLCTTILTAQENKTSLLRTKWHLHAYQIGNKKYSPEKKEREDFIHFKDEKTFVSKSEGIIEEGKYFVNLKQEIITLIDRTGASLKAFIISVDEDTLILTYDIKEIKELKVVYKSRT